MSGLHRPTLPPIHRHRDCSQLEFDGVGVRVAVTVDPEAVDDVEQVDVLPVVVDGGDIGQGVAV